MQLIDLSSDSESERGIPVKRRPALVMPEIGRRLVIPLVKKRTNCPERGSKQNTGLAKPVWTPEKDVPSLSSARCKDLIEGFSEGPWKMSTGAGNDLKDTGASAWGIKRPRTEKFRVSGEGVSAATVEESSVSLERRGSGKRKSEGSDSSDSDCCILEEDPSLKIQKGKRHGGDDDELIVTGEKGPVACRDFPHARHSCGHFPFETSPHQNCCPLCHCYVCDSVAPCKLWGSGLAPSDHCHANDKELKWKLLRTSKKSHLSKALLTVKGNPQELVLPPCPSPTLHLSLSPPTCNGTIAGMQPAGDARRSTSTLSCQPQMSTSKGLPADHRVTASNLFSQTLANMGQINPGLSFHLRQAPGQGSPKSSLETVLPQNSVPAAVSFPHGGSSAANQSSSSGRCRPSTLRGHEQSLPGHDRNKETPGSFFGDFSFPPWNGSTWVSGPVISTPQDVFHPHQQALSDFRVSQGMHSDSSGPRRDGTDPDSSTVWPLEGVKAGRTQPAGSSVRLPSTFSGPGQDQNGELHNGQGHASGNRMPHGEAGVLWMDILQEAEQVLTPQGGQHSSDSPGAQALTSTIQDQIAVAEHASTNGARSGLEASRWETVSETLDRNSVRIQQQALPFDMQRLEQCQLLQAEKSLQRAADAVLSTQTSRPSVYSPTPIAAATTPSLEHLPPAPKVSSSAALSQTPSQLPPASFQPNSCSVASLTTSIQQVPVSMVSFLHSENYSSQLPHPPTLSSMAPPPPPQLPLPVLNLSKKREGKDAGSGSTFLGWLTDLESTSQEPVLNSGPLSELTPRQNGFAEPCPLKEPCMYQKCRNPTDEPQPYHVNWQSQCLHTTVQGSNPPSEAVKANFPTHQQHYQQQSLAHQQQHVLLPVGDFPHPFTCVGPEFHFQNHSMYSQPVDFSNGPPQHQVNQTHHQNFGPVRALSAASVHVPSATSTLNSNAAYPQTLPSNSGQLPISQTHAYEPFPVSAWQRDHWGQSLDLGILNRAGLTTGTIVGSIAPTVILTDGNRAQAPNSSWWWAGANPPGGTGVSPSWAGSGAGVNGGEAASVGGNLPANDSSHLENSPCQGPNYGPWNSGWGV